MYKKGNELCLLLNINSNGMGVFKFFIDAVGTHFYISSFKALCKSIQKKESLCVENSKLKC